MGDWCVSYWIKVYYQYDYAFGLRIPLKLEVESSEVREHVEGVHTGKTAFNLTPFDGNADDFLVAGMPTGQIYEGREVLAQLCQRGGGCKAGIRGDLPGPNPSFSVDVGGVNLLEEAFTRGPIRSGQIEPPDVGESMDLGESPINFDLMGGSANLGVVGAEILPVLRLSMGSKKKKLGVSYGESAICSDTPMHNNKWENRDRLSKELDFTISDNSREMLFHKPSYVFDLALELGIRPELWVDLGVWDHNWALAAVWLPWGISSPEFTLDGHEGALCGHTFEVTGGIR